MAIDPIGIEGLDQFRKNLKVINAELPKQMRLAGNEAAQVIVMPIRALVPKRSGKAASTVKAASTQGAARVRAGGNRAPYYPWLDFGGRVGKQKHTERKFYSDGRYLFPVFYSHRDQITEVYRQELIKLIESAGIDLE